MKRTYQKSLNYWIYKTKLENGEFDKNPDLNDETPKNYFGDVDEEFHKLWVD